ncbi:MAG: right-handed parallel beta-helix repeat-containing protein [Candidatus Zixiibacteriota bacterium]|nr:MAG: right-handed parallel beta-helix repeat-containing protein [candidate division Zixibacteria bacterium]
MTRKTVIVAAVLSFSPVWVFATIINIPADYPTIQLGINASTDGDTVLVQPGTYVENVNFNGHNIVLGSLFLTTGDTSYIRQTAIDGDSVASVIILGNSEDSTAVVTGLTIQNGLAQAYQGDINGGGILCYNSTPTIVNNVIRNNHNKYGIGAGVFCRNASPRIKSNLIYSNYSAGITCRNSSNPFIVQNTISLNGEGIISYDSFPEIKNSIIWYNGRKEIRGSPFVNYCAVRGGWPGPGNIDINPMFLDPYNFDFNICSQSPCIDTGDPTILDPDGTRSDIGLYYPSHPDCSTGNLYYVSVSGNDTTGDGSLNNPFRTVQHTVNLSYLEDTVLVLPGVYNENIFVGAKNLTLASNYIFTADTLDILNTVVDGNNTDALLTIYHCDSLSQLTGFTFIHGDPVVTIRYCDNVIISNNIFEQNTFTPYGFIVTTGYNSKIRVLGNKFRDNINAQIIDSNDYTDGLIVKGNEFYGNINTCVMFSGTNGTIFENNVVRDNIGMVFYCWMIAGPSIFRGNVIYDNHCPWALCGAIFSAEDSHLLVENNIIYNNTGVNQTYLGYFYEEHHSPGPIDFKNDIIWDNYYPNPEHTLMLYDNNIDFHMTYSDVQQGWPGIGNFEADPMFRDPVGGDFHLMSTACGDPYDSPCIDAGDPNILDNLLDCSWGLGGPRSDMGAFGGGDSLITAIYDDLPSFPKKLMLLQNYPNPFNARTTIRFVLPKSQEVELSIYDLLGRRIEVLIDEYREAGVYKITFDASVLSSGVYFYRLRAGDAVETKRMVLLK